MSLKRRSVIITTIVMFDFGSVALIRRRGFRGFI